MKAMTLSTLVYYRDSATLCHSHRGTSRELLGGTDTSVETPK